MATVLVLYVHPNPAHSRVNAALIAAAATVEGVMIHDLYETYPDLVIDVAREQALLEQHAAIVLQFPLQWYSTPAILKEWQDAVLEEGWAYGAGGTALTEKTLLCAPTAGGASAMYHRDGGNRFTIHELLRPLEQTAWRCGMRYVAPFVTFAAHRIDATALAAQCASYRTLLERLVRGDPLPTFDSTREEQ